MVGININDKKWDKYKNNKVSNTWSGATGSQPGATVGSTTQTSQNSSYIRSQTQTQYSGSPTWEGATGNQGPGATVTGVPSQGTTGVSGVSPILSAHSVPKSYEYEQSISTLPNNNNVSAGGQIHDRVNPTSSDKRLVPGFEANLQQIGGGDPSAIGGGGGVKDTVPRHGGHITDRAAQWFDDDGFLKLGGNFGTANAQGIGSPTSDQQKYTDNFLKDIRDNAKAAAALKAAEEKKIAVEEKAATHYSVTRGSLDQEFGYSQPKDLFEGDDRLGAKYVPFHGYFDNNPRKINLDNIYNLSSSASGSKYTISGSQPSGKDHKYGNETIADLVQSGQGSRKYNNIVQNWQNQFLRQAGPGSKINLKNMKDWVGKQIAKINKWNISDEEKKIYRDDLTKRHNQLKQFAVKDPLVGVRSDPLKGYSAETQWTFSRGARGEKPGKILTWEDLKDNKGNSWY